MTSPPALSLRSGSLSNLFFFFFPEIGVTVKPLPCAEMGAPLFSAPPLLPLLLLPARQWRRSVRKLGS